MTSRGFFRAVGWRRVRSVKSFLAGRNSIIYISILSSMGDTVISRQDTFS